MELLNLRHNKHVPASMIIPTGSETDSAVGIRWGISGEIIAFLYMCVLCMCVCLYVCMCVCMYVCLYVCKYVCIVYVCACVCMCVHVYVIYMHVCMYV